MLQILLFSVALCLHYWYNISKMRGRDLGPVYIHANGQLRFLILFVDGGFSDIWLAIFFEHCVNSIIFFKYGRGGLNALASRPKKP